MNSPYTEQQVISQCKTWIEKVIIGLNFCPFAKKDYVNNRVRYRVVETSGIDHALQAVLDEMHHLQTHPETATTLVIFREGFASFDRYLDLLDYANQLLSDEGFEGVYQLASFHPNYCFEGVAKDDVTNYTNRAPWPILHLIREDMVEKVVALHPDPESIPETNMLVCEQKGAEFFATILNNLNHNHKN
ncbi:DUF1415 domain-containing protein [Thalassotalea maritima]|uniref:DUF1415 domain-containing protein n=1 Tax=Thalassotalea maritima TaxID=3242416 RepID=UPI0035271278